MLGESRVEICASLILVNNLSHRKKLCRNTNSFSAAERCEVSQQISSCIQTSYSLNKTFAIAEAMFLTSARSSKYF